MAREAFIRSMRWNGWTPFIAGLLLVGVTLQVHVDALSISTPHAAVHSELDRCFADDGEGTHHHHRREMFDQHMSHEDAHQMATSLADLLLANINAESEMNEIKAHPDTPAHAKELIERSVVEIQLGVEAESETSTEELLQLLNQGAPDDACAALLRPAEQQGIKCIKNALAKARSKVQGQLKSLRNRLVNRMCKVIGGYKFTENSGLSVGRCTAFLKGKAQRMEALRKRICESGGREMAGLAKMLRQAQVGDGNGGQCCKCPGAEDL